MKPPGTSGVAHFLEHLMFKGTDKIPPNAFSALIEAQGGDDNAFTSWDYTAYFQRIAADRLEMVMEMEADRMRNLRMTEDDVTTERQVILEERAQRTDSDPGSLLERTDARGAIPEPPLRHPDHRLAARDGGSCRATMRWPGIRAITRPTTPS